VQPNGHFSTIGGVLFNGDATRLLRCPGGVSASYAIPSSVTHLADSAFDHCVGLDSVTVSSNVFTIGNAVFAGCWALQAIHVDMANSNFSSADGVLFNKNGTTLIQCPGSRPNGYAIPHGVITIASKAFDYCGVTNVIIPGTVTTIGDRAFSTSSLLVGNIPASVTSIGVDAFTCWGLTAINVDTNNAVYCSMDGVLCKKQPLEVIQYPRARPGSYAIPDGVTAVQTRAFAGSENLTSVTIPSSVTNIGLQAFNDCTSLTEFTVASENGSYRSVDGVLFDKNLLTLVRFPLPRTGGYSIPDGVTRITERAFDTCTELISVTIPASVTAIDRQAFDSCEKLLYVYFKGEAPAAGWGVFSGADNATVYYMPNTMTWGATFAERPALLWNPVFSALFHGQGIDGLDITVTGTVGIPIVLQVSTNLEKGAWNPLETNALVGGEYRYTDLDWALHPKRFYRIGAP
jgi:hypothetical protein